MPFHADRTASVLLMLSLIRVCDRPPSFPWHRLCS